VADEERRGHSLRARRARAALTVVFVASALLPATVFIGPLIVTVFLTLLRFVEEEMVWAQT